MALTHWITGRASETTATVVVRASTDENVTVVANGETQVVACATATNDGNAVATFAGLSPGQTYPYTVNGAAGGTLRTFPASTPYWVALSSCWSPNATDPLALKLLTPPLTGASKELHTEMVAGLKAFFCLGDLVYMNTSGTINGYTVVDVDGGTLADTKNVDYRRNYYRATRLNGGLKTLIRNVPTYFMKDDHEYDPDNACNDLLWLQSKFGGATQTDLDEMWAAADTGWKEWVQGNPPSELSGPHCFRVRIGPVEFFATDQIYDRAYHATADSAAKLMMSAAQEEWLLTAFAASTAPFKVWLSSKQFISSCGRNADGWCNIGGLGKGYETQLTRILSDARFPRAGALSVTGDEHMRSDLWVSETRFGNHAAISQISAGPATIPAITDPNDGMAYRDGVRSRERDTSAVSGAGYCPRGEQSYVLLRVLSDRVERYILGSRYGLRFMGYVGTADNIIRR